MIRNLRLVAAAVFYGWVFGAACCSSALAQSQNENLIRNPKFESGGGSSKDWVVKPAEAGTIVENEIDIAQLFYPKSLKLQSAEAGKSAYLLQNIPLKPGKSYILTYAVKADAGQEYRAYVEWSGFGNTAAIAGWQKATGNWEKKTVAFDYPSGVNAAYLALQLKTPGKVHFTDICLGEKRQAKPASFTWTLDNIKYHNTIYASCPVKQIQGTIEVRDPQVTRVEIVFGKKESDKPVFSGSYQKNLSAFSFSIPAENLKDGDYILKARALGSQGEVVAELQQMIQKLPPTPAVEVVAGQDNIWLLNGKPFFPIGLCAMDDKNNYLIKGMPEYTAAGFNVFLTTVLDNDCLMEAAKYNAKVIAIVQRFHLYKPENEHLWLKDAQKIIDANISNPALIGYWTWDEPNCRAPEQLTVLKNRYEWLRKHDPYRLVFWNQMPRFKIAEIAPYMEYSDVGSVDIYPIPNLGHSELANRTLSCVGEYTDKMHATAHNQKPVWMILQGFAFADSPSVSGKGLYPTWSESRFMAYNAILHGATGIIYWGCESVAKPSFFRDLFRVTSELREMSPVFVGRTVSPSTVSVDSPKIVFQHKICDDGEYLIAANESKETVTAKWTTPVKENNIFVAFEDRQAELLNGVFSDVFKPYEVHVYTTSRRKMNPVGEVKSEFLEGLAEKRERIGKLPDYEGTAKWIWSENRKNGVKSRGFLRGVFSIQEKVKSAKTLVSVDGSYTLYLNGTKVNSIAQGWSRMVTTDVTSLLKEGENVFAVDVENGGLIGYGFILEFSAETVSGQKVSFVSDENWQASGIESSGWQQLDFQAKGWQKVKVIAPYGGGPWGKQVKIAPVEPGEKH